MTQSTVTCSLKVGKQGNALGCTTQSYCAPFATAVHWRFLSCTEAVHPQYLYSEFSLRPLYFRTALFSAFSCSWRR